MTKFVFVTGGVVSSLGKGIAAASLAAILESRGLKVTLIQLDPYLNADPGTMSPYQHGEVFVTDDGAETDLDLGHYERFTGRPASQADNITTGRIYQEIIAKERRGAYLGSTDQVIHRERQRGRRFRLVRDRRHRRRYRGAALLRGHSPAWQRASPRVDRVHPPDAGSLHPERGRAQDQADPGFGQRASLDWYPARCPALPHRPAFAQGRAAEDCPVLQCSSRSRYPGARRGEHL